MSWDAMLAEIDALIEDLASTEPPSAVDQPDHGLTRREAEVLGLLAEGHSNRAIAESLSVSERTVENHVFHIFTKLGVNSRTAAATFAVRHGMA